MGNCIIIAEAGVNHNGSVDLALKLCDAAKYAGANVIKFQTWKTDLVLTHDVEQAEYQKTNTGSNESQYDMVKKLELTYDDFRKIKKHCDEIGIAFASTADEEESLDFLVDLGIPFIKVASGDIGNVSFLRYIGSKKLPVILSTGMSSIADVDISLNALYEGGASDITILHCTTNYPCPYEEVNLKAMLALKNAFQLSVGYSDHTIGTEVPVSAVALGASVIEKHFTLDRTMNGPDHLASTEPDDFRKLVEEIRHIEAALGNGIKTATESEKMIKKVVTKRVVAKGSILAGEKFTDKNICVKRSNHGELACNWDKVIGRQSKKTYKLDDGIII